MGVFATGDGSGCSSPLLFRPYECWCVQARASWRPPTTVPPLYAPSAAYCGTSATKSCECMQRCRDYFCRRDSSGNEACSGFGARPDRGCYERVGVPPDEQVRPSRGVTVCAALRSWLAAA